MINGTGLSFDLYCCFVGYNSTKEKQKLQNVMAFGSEAEPIPTVARPQPLSPQDETEVDRFEEVMREIEERKEFLEEMEVLGEGQKYRTKLMTEISQVIKDNNNNCLKVLTEPTKMAYQLHCHRWLIYPIMHIMFWYYFTENS